MSTIMRPRDTADQPTRTQRRRGGLCLVRRGLLVLVALLVALPVVGFAYETGMASVDTRNFPPPGMLVAIDGRAMHLYCTGRGSPTVVIDAGLGGWSLDWSTVQPDIARFARVCSYDRAGLGWSASDPAPGDGQHAVADLHALLAHSGEQGPFVLVGHSNGGLRVVLYAAAYPHEVAGLVLVDPTPHATDAERVAFLSPAEQTEYLRLVQTMQPPSEGRAFDFLGWMQTLRPFGVPRLLTSMLLEGSSYAYVRTETQPAYRYGMNHPARLATTIAETEQRQNTIDYVRAVASLGSIPLTVLASTKFTSFYRDPLPANLSGRLLELVEKTAWAAKRDMARLSSHGTIAAVERSGHYIQFDRPDAVVDVVRTMVELVPAR